ncbi:natural cytotoxicity triggering receptor 3 ligand 1-like isoform X2 [Vombatus ursinus]|uniref:natural cytotoxicity triggering receptor 3 ligand 1-like isoform X2 n=1 Tax=Vombatus ursinus TaxID=29139 RepID=UPI000FFD86C1|nr:natural cytotoxicity triggering receptor 3 ligand 1-like isoform X2 [Vombatus ursinus]
MALRGHYLAAAGMFLGVLLGSCGAQHAPGTLEMEMNGKAQMASLNTNVTIPCILYESGSVTLNISLIGVRWFLRRADSDKEDKVFEYNGGKQTQFRPGASISLSRLKKGNASLFLPFIQLQEGGEYRCEIIIPPTKEERTSRVDVVAQPQIANKKVISSTQSPDVENTENTEETSKIPSRSNDGHGKDYFIYTVIFVILLLFRLFEVM